ncbi:hypothetical protein [Chitinophaga silvisoli]|uniref:Uncharacterized protein n=1 Tax=Chitinophaga silvisoli TaxID=2291814 RepID=A0A3E1NX31_9BACT|nr:hypothetical protein [Chitinophaga silvisoli]RFM32489.1 hypothetical protein DXN04_22655 [Chitinophaga silvisoli]
MNSFFKSLPVIAAITCFACKAPSHVYELHKMKDFNIGAASAFVNQVRRLQPIDNISILDTRYDGNEFNVNLQNIFLDTTQADQANYYNYRRRAAEINVPADSLYSCLQLFDKAGVNEFVRNKDFFLFRVVVGFTTNKGYLYTENEKAKSGDTLIATSARNRGYEYKVILQKQLDKHWFEYYEAPM